MGGTLELVCVDNCRMAIGTTLRIAKAAAALNGSFASVSMRGFGAGAFAVTYDHALHEVGLLVTQATAPVVPEPSTVLLAALGLLGVAARVRARRG